MVNVEAISLDEYTRDVLPHSASLWAHGRSLEVYAGDLREFAESGYGRRRFRFAGIRDGGAFVTSCKIYERELRCGDRMLRAIGIGAVFTRKSHRGRGLATLLLGALLDRERAAGTDVAYLFSDIRPQFYEDLGFKTLPSRIFTLRADSLAFERIAPSPIKSDDWTLVARCFAMLDAHRPYALHRTPLVWEMLRERRSGPGRVNIAIRSGRRILAYCLGRREIESDAFVVDEFSFAGLQHAHLVPPLLRAAAGDLRKITGWLPPAPARHALPRGSVRTRRDGITMVAPLSSIAHARWKRDSREILRAPSDTVWSADHV